MDNFMHFSKRYIGFLSFLVIISLSIVSCSKEYSVDPDISKSDSTSEEASISFKANADSSILGSQIGMFVKDVTVDSSYISFPITVKKAGSYNVKTLLYFGTDSLEFYGEGLLSLEDSVVKLYPVDFGDFAAGTYTTQNITKNTIFLNDSLTGFHPNVTITISDIVTPIPSTPLGDSAWTFVIDGKDTVVGTFSIANNTSNVYSLTGSAVNSDYSLSLVFQLPSDMSALPITISSSNTTTMGITIVNTTDAYVGTAKQTGSSATITITKYDSVAKKIEGTFTGSLTKVSDTNIINISNGQFSMTIP